MAIAVLTAMVLQLMAPEAGRLAPRWIIPSIELMLLVTLIAGDPGRIDKRSRFLRQATTVLISVMTFATIAGVTVLMVDILWGIKGASDAASLFGRGAALWVTNIITFSLWYWHFDRGGPAERAAGSKVPPSFTFPENVNPERAREGWMPNYPDYLFLAYTNATAFSPADTLPVRTWAKMMMLTESLISLVTAIIVIARAIGVLPG
jgi:uncharacterized membrane protein